MANAESVNAASLSDPQYYRKNLETVISWVLQRYPDILTGPEQKHFSSILSLPDSERALLTRLIMRRGDFFRIDALDYPEIAVDLTDTVQALKATGLIYSVGSPTADDLGRLFRLAELSGACAQVPHQSADPRPLRKRDLLGWIRDCSPSDYAQLLKYLYEKSPWVALAYPERYERLRLLFFGNRRQTWADFVLVELGQTQYEAVPLDGIYRPFQTRAELITYERLSRTRDVLDDSGNLTSALATLPELPVATPWVESRRRRVLLAFGQQAYRQREWSLALRAWALSELPDATVRRVRLLEQRGFREQAARECRSSLEQALPAATRSALERVLARCQGTPRQRRTTAEFIPTARMTLLDWRDGQHLESAVARAISTGGNHAYYTENTLFTALFGLVFWRALFAPVQGAFFHPFQSAPADLYEPEFTQRRQDLIDTALTQLTSSPDTQWILDTYDERFGTTNRFVHWQAVPRSLLESVLKVIPRHQLTAVLRYMLDDLIRHRSGYPDLLVLNEQQRRYELIEVKGPGDRLQPQQTEFLHWCQAQGIPASVLVIQRPYAG